MNAEKIMAAIGGINEKYIEEYSIVKPVKSNTFNTMPTSRRWIYKLCGIVTIVAILRAICIPVINNK